SEAGAPTVREHTWGYHYAAVTAASLDGADQITLENYKRSGDVGPALADLERQLRERFTGELAGAIATIEANFRGDSDAGRKARMGAILHFLQNGRQAAAAEAKALGDTLMSESLGQMWFFHMIGSQAGQSFHEQAAASGYFMNPLTVAVQSASRVGGRRFYFTRGATTLRTGYTAIPADLLRDIRADLADPQRRLRITGYASPRGFKSTNLTLAGGRANTLRDLLVAQGIPNARIRVVNGGETTAFSNLQPGGIPPKDANSCAVLATES
ncbi:MAG TPA: OmpA family protein, partial [Chloroflexia bacterium]|nr:OmpA family protein [Chloroflexia bacterium]